MNTIEKLVNPWLQQRQQILVILSNLARLLPYADNPPVSLSKFFQLLIDYTCAGHLQIFTICLEQSIDHFSSAQQILNKINNSTDNILKFNYKYNKFKNISVVDVTTLLEQFAERIELEDLLINMKVIHKYQIN